MQKIESIRRGRIWLNIYKDRNGELALTIEKSYPAKEGGWKRTPFLIPKYNDLMNLIEALSEFMEFQHGRGLREGWEQ